MTCWRSVKTGFRYELLEDGRVRVTDPRRGREGVFNADGSPDSGEIAHCGTDTYHVIQWAAAHDRVLRGVTAMTAAAESAAGSAEESAAPR